MEHRKSYVVNSGTFHNFCPSCHKDTKNFNSNFTKKTSNNNIIYPKHKNSVIITPFINYNSNKNNFHPNGRNSDNLLPVPNDFLNNAHRTNLFRKFSPKISPFCSFLHHRFSTNNLSFKLNKSNDKDSNSGFHYKKLGKHSCESLHKNSNIESLSNEKYYSDFLNSICGNELHKKK